MITDHINNTIITSTETRDLNNTDFALMAQG